MSVDLLLLLCVLLICNAFPDQVTIPAVPPPQLPPSSSAVLGTGASSALKSLYWVGNHAGLFSHFMQLKIMYSVARRLERKLVVVPTKSVHYEVDIDMCRIFELPADISCGNITNVTESCVDALPESNEMQSLCYKGSIKFGNFAKGREAILRGIEEPLPLRFHRSMLPLVAEFKTKLGFDPASSAVVHWRRGDQLESRCKHGADISVNCGSGNDLVNRVNRNIAALYGNTSSLPPRPPPVVYVATNEPRQSHELKALQLAGFRCFQDFAEFSSLHIFEILAIEVSLMMDAYLFLAWGVSEMNDLVEWERFRIGTMLQPEEQQQQQQPVEEQMMMTKKEEKKKIICVDQDPIEKIEQMTWCSMHTNSTPFDMDKTHMQHFKWMPTKRPTLVPPSGSGKGGRGGGANRSRRQNKKYAVNQHD